MIARLERWLLVAELAFYGLLAVFWHLFPGWPALATIILIPLLAGGGRGLYLAAAYRLARQWDTPAGRAARTGCRPRLILQEWTALTLTHSILQPLVAPLWRPGATPTGNSTAPVVVLVHGYCCNGAYWLPLWRWLRRRGVAVSHPPTLEPPFASIDRHADALAQHLDAVSNAAPHAPLVLVGHSMGGLTIRACQARHGLRHVARIITLGTPHRGSRLARLGWGRNAREMQPDSPWLRALEAAAPCRDIALTAVAAAGDELVTPFSSALPQDADSQWIFQAGHLALGWSVPVRELILGTVETVRRNPPATSAKPFTE